MASTDGCKDADETGIRKFKMIKVFPVNERVSKFKKLRSLHLSRRMNVTGRKLA